MSNIIKKNKGNAAIITLAALFIVCVLSLFLIDLSRIYVAREQAKNASDAAALAVTQKLLFFDSEGLEEEAREVIFKNDCKFHEMEVFYDEVTVTAIKEVEYLFLGNLFIKDSIIFCTSRAKVVYPWDESLGRCKSLVLNSKIERKNL
jgi:uncharacterized membrane protein